ALAGQPFYQNAGFGQKLPDGRSRSVGWNTRPDNLPLGGLKLHPAEPSVRLDNLNHVNPVRQGCVKSPTNVVWLAKPGYSQFEVFRFARRPSRSPARIRNPRMW